MEGNTSSRQLLATVMLALIRLSIHLFSKPLITFNEGAGAYPSIDWVRGGVHSGQVVGLIAKLTHRQTRHG